MFSHRDKAMFAESRYNPPEPPPPPPDGALPQNTLNMTKKIYSGSHLRSHRRKTGHLCKGHSVSGSIVQTWHRERKDSKRVKGWGLGRVGLEKWTHRKRETGEAVSKKRTREPAERASGRAV